MINSILTHALDGILAIDLDGKISYANHSALQLRNYQEHQLIGIPHSSLVQDSKNSELDKIISRLDKQEQPEAIQTIRLTRDKRPVFVSARFSPILNKQGQLIAISELIRPLTAEERMSNKAQDLLETAPDAMVIVNESGTIQRMNAQATNIFGYQKEELLGQKIEQLIPQRFHGNHSQHRANYFKSPKIRPMGANLELFAKHKDGHEFPVEISLSPLKTARELLVSAAIRDITARKKTEQELHSFNHQLQVKNKELEQFAYIASHDLQEPLRTVKSFVDLLNQHYAELLEGQGKHFLHFISQATNRMEELVVGLLNYSRIGQSKQKSPVDCSELLREIKQDLASSISIAKATVHSKGLPQVEAYPTELRQLFQNLIVNAIKFREDKRAPMITIRAERKKDHFLFQVADNGIGIAPQHLERIFVIFQRLHPQSDYEGTGIGLALCQKIVELHGGSIWGQSTLGKGSTFFFTLPINPMHDLAIQEPTIKT